MVGLWKYVFSETPENPLHVWSHSGRTRIPFRWWFSIGALLGLCLCLTFISPQFSTDIPQPDQPVLIMIAIYMAMGWAFLFISELIYHTRSGVRVMMWVLIAGAVMRTLMLLSTPILEVDYNRYLWDGAVVAQGLNPYTFAPEDVLLRRDIPAPLSTLADVPASTIGNINHPKVRSIYPPVAQGAFALAYLLKPWGLTAWRMVLLSADIATLLLLMLLLKKLGRSPLWSAVYWLNPLLLKEIFNAAHMDILLLPFLLGALLLMLRNHPYPASIALGIAVGIKFWPALLFPLFMRRMWPDFSRMFMAAAVFGITCTALLLPMILSTWDASAGLSAYSMRWELNDAAFRLLVWTAAPLLKIFGYHPGHSQMVARIAVAILLLTWTAYQVLRRVDNDCDWLDRALLIIAALFLLSPTQFPWYSLWMLPLLAISPRRPLLLLTPLLPLYYLWHYLEPQGKTAFFHYGVVWLEFLPVWGFIVRDWLIRRRMAGLISMDENR